MISHKHSRANNTYVPDYDPSRPTTHITYLDANNLYGCAMSMPLPISDFRWLSRDEIDALEISTLPTDSEIGYILEVDLEYPRHLHDLHSDYPLAPERLHVTEEMLSPYSRHLHDQLDIGRSTSKLVPNLQQKTGYVIHHRNLQQCIDLGMKLTALHRVLAFSRGSQVLRAAAASRLPAVRVGGCHPPPEDGAHTRPPPIRRLRDPRAEQARHVRLPLRIHQVYVRGASAAPIYRHRLALLRNYYRRHLRRHARRRRPL